ncbi:MAG: putative DNA binding domain-containing protein [Bacillota bacterium]|nr:putative DNA binding domain-containing protein [Bacillota bacterium]
MEFLYDNKLNEKVIEDTLNRLLQNVENEIVEFKEASNQFDLDRLGRYVSAISNEANLQNKQYGWLIFGVDDKQHQIKGTSYKESSRALEKLKLDIANQTTGGLTFMNIFVVRPNTDRGRKRVLMFQIPAAAIGMPTGWKNRYYARSGESLTDLSQEKIDRIRGQHRIDWSKLTIKGSSVNNLDPGAVKLARSNYTQILRNSSNPKAADEFDKLNDEEFLTKMHLIRDRELTNAAMVLLGREEDTDLFEFPPAIMWRLYDDRGNLTDHELFNVPFVLAIDKAYNKIRNLTYRYMPSQMSLFPTEVQQYDHWAIRELLNNCIAHQDYSQGRRIYLNEFKDHIMISNAGQFLPGDIRPVLEPAYAPPYYKNPLLAQTMVNFRMIETASSGIRRVYSIMQERLFPLPDYDLSEYNVVKVTVYGKVLDENYTSILFQNPDMDLRIVYLLDRVQKGEHIDRKDANKLRKMNLIEGKMPNLYISANIAERLDQKAQYIKNKGFDDQYYKKLIVNYLETWGKGKKSDFVALLSDKLPDGLSSEQKSSKVRNLLQSLRREGIITVDSTNQQKSSWTLSKS